MHSACDDHLRLVYFEAWQGKMRLTVREEVLVIYFLPVLTTINLFRDVDDLQFAALLAIG